MSFIFPMFTPVFEHDGADGEQICFESYLMNAPQAQEKIDKFAGRYGKGVVGMVLPFSNRILVAPAFRDEFEATFLSFGVCYEEFETGPGNYTTVVYMQDDGKLDSIEVGSVKFINTEV